ncbi:hypothetical protein KQX54_014330 [Cotesia glomerata]|uniref:Uncharacterized protein n=1 Tax=Cotesia glomerata TaxID=32391 RepID=A0AAV7I3F3_COTGL|nr:hypothetical protein KQX54_014330 [Cotesia glomerata]
MLSRGPTYSPGWGPANQSDIIDLTCDLEIRKDLGRTSRLEPIIIVNTGPWPTSSRGSAIFFIEAHPHLRGSRIFWLRARALALGAANGWI